jgi:hypothetical protein
MNAPSFMKWMKLRRSQPPKELPESDRLMHVIAAAGPQGISRGDLGKEIQLGPETIDALLDSLVGLRQVTIVFQQDGTAVVRAASQVMGSSHPLRQ